LQVAVFACDYANGKSADSDCLSLDGAWRCASAQKTGAKGLAKGDPKGDRFIWLAK
jgi:hypothetical protein